MRVAGPAPVGPPGLEAYCRMRRDFEIEDLDGYRLCFGHDAGAAAG